MVSKEEIKACKDYCAERGFRIEDKEIAYLFVNRELRNPVMAYKMVIREGLSDELIEKYDKSPRLACLRQYMNDNWTKRKTEERVATVAGSISFEENRDALIGMLSDIETMMNTNQIEKKDAMKMMTDIRIKLNDKFNMKEQQVEQRIIVQPKFSHICEHTHKECWLQTRRYAMEHWHLVPDPNYHEEETN